MLYLVLVHNECIIVCNMYNMHVFIVYACVSTGIQYY